MQEQNRENMGALFLYYYCLFRKALEMYVSPLELFLFCPEDIK